MCKDFDPITASCAPSCCVCSYNEDCMDAVYYPVVNTPVGKVPLIGSTMTDEREREIAAKYPVRREVVSV